MYLQPGVVATQSSNLSSLLPYKKKLYLRASITHEEGNMARGMEDPGKGEMSEQEGGNCRRRHEE